MENTNFESIDNPVPEIIELLKFIKTEDAHVLTAQRNLVDKLLIAEDILVNGQYEAVGEKFERYCTEEFPAIRRILQKSIMLPRTYVIESDTDVQNFLKSCESCVRIIDRFINYSETPVSKYDILIEHFNKMLLKKERLKYRIQSMWSKFWKKTTVWFDKYRIK